MILALDLSTVKTGYAFGGVNDGAPKGGVWRLPRAADHVFDRTLAGIYESISSLAKLIKPQFVVIENFIMPTNDSNAHTIASLIQLTGAARAAGKNAGAEIILVGSSTVRKHFIGHGGLPSEKAKQAVQDRCTQMGWSFVDDNHADSIACWSWGMATKFPKWSPRSTPLFRERAA